MFSLTRHLICLVFVLYLYLYLYLFSVARHLICIPCSTVKVSQESARIEIEEKGKHITKLWSYYIYFNWIEDTKNTSQSFGHNKKQMHKLQKCLKMFSLTIIHLIPCRGLMINWGEF